MCQEKLRRTMQNTVKIDSTPTETQTKHLPNRILIATIIFFTLQHGGVWIQTPCSVGLFCVCTVCEIIYTHTQLQKTKH